MKKTFLILIAVLFILPVYSYAQAPDTLWAKHYGFSAYDEAWQIKKTIDGGFIVVGYTNNDGDIYLLKTDEFGDTLWTRMLGNTPVDIGRSIEPLEDGGYILTGYSDGDIVLIKTDSWGNILWDSYLDTGWGRAVRTTTDGGFIVAGYSSVIDSSEQIYIAKTDSGGSLIWSKTYGGNEPEMAWDVLETPDGGFAVLGWTESYGYGMADIYLLKIDSGGDTLWTRTYGNIGNDEGRSIIVKDDGGFVIAGKLSRDTYNYDISVINTDSAGNIIWSASFIQNDRTVANSIFPASNGGFVLTGTKIDANYLFSSFVMKVNDNGDSLWTRVIEDPEQNLYCRSIVQADDGGYVAAGYHQVPGRANDVFLVKLAPDIVGTYDEIVSLPEHITLHRNYPNPFNANTTISFTLPEPGNISLSIYDLLGRKIAIMADGDFNAGVYDVNFDASDLTSGIYFYNLKAGDISETKSMILLK
jgi:hypothetical protein